MLGQQFADLSRSQVVAVDRSRDSPPATLSPFPQLLEILGCGSRDTTCAVLNLSSVSLPLTMAATLSRGNGPLSHPP